MNAVGIDVSKGSSMVAAVRPLGKVVAKPFEVCHTANELRKLADFLKSLDGEVRVIMEYTGRYYEPIARYLHDDGFFVAAVHAKLIHDFGNNSIRKVKTDKADALKIANYGLANWTSLKGYSPEDDTRLLLKTCNRQYNQYMKLMVASKNNLIALLDQTFPDANTLFSKSSRLDGHEKWVDFVGKFWHCECVSSLSPAAFTTRYNRWCGYSGYQKDESKAAEIHAFARTKVQTLPKTEGTMMLVKQAVTQLNSLLATLAALRPEMQRLAESLPEFPAVIAMYGVGNIFGPQLIAEIGDIRRFMRKQSLVAFAGVDAPPYQSGSFVSKDRKISKRGSSLLRKTLFLVMSCILQNAPDNDPVFQFLDKKRAEGKRYYVYMVAGANKFLRIYYARLSEYLAQPVVQQ
jgi:transposase